MERNQYSGELVEKSGCENVFCDGHFTRCMLLRGLLAGFWRAKSEEETCRGEELMNGI